MLNNDGLCFNNLKEDYRLIPGFKDYSINIYGYIRNEISGLIRYPSRVKFITLINDNGEYKKVNRVSIIKKVFKLSWNDENFNLLQHFNKEMLNMEKRNEKKTKRNK